MAPQQPSGQPHHHRSTTKVSHKPFKAKHSTKSALKEKSKGKVESLERGLRHPKQQFTLSKTDRRNQAKQKRLALNSEHLRSNSIFSGTSPAARITAVIPLCPDVDVEQVTKNLVASLDLADARPVFATADWQFDVARFKQKVRFITPPRRDLWDVLDTCRIADFVLFVLSAEQEVDTLGEQMLRSVESQGVSTVVTAVQHLSSAGNAKKQHGVQDSLKSYITHFFAAQEKVHSLDSRQECINLMRSLCTTTPKGIRWREDRSWMLVEETKWGPDALKVTGVVRGRGLNPDRLVQVGDLGDFQIQKVVVHPARTARESLDEDTTHVPTADQDQLVELAPEEVVMQDRPAASIATSDRKGVLLDDHHYFSDDETAAPRKPKRLPKGTSDYQAAWYLDDVDYSGSDLESVASDHPDEDMLDSETQYAPEPTEAAETEYAQSDVDDANPDEEDYAAYRARKTAARDDAQFPDEIELPPNALARERLHRYRGLKSLRSSPWDTTEDLPHEPTEWRRLLEIQDYRAAKAKFVNEALVGGIPAGSRVDIYFSLAGHDATTLSQLPQPRALFSLLRHEHKRTSVNASINLPADAESPVRAKDELIIQSGPRRLRINPLFSQLGNSPNNVHKFERYLQPGATSCASFIGPVGFGSTPVLYLRRTGSAGDAEQSGQDAMDTDATPPAGQATGYQLVATGTLLPPSTNRVIAKRAVLTGHPYKIHKRLVTIRYMFFNDQDVAWFKALQLWTRRGRSGFIKESLGTHGFFKAEFDGKINPQDSVAVSLYKRIWPKWARAFVPGQQ